MPYATQADLCPGRIPERALAQLTNDSGADIIVPAVVDEKLTEASGIVDGYCRQRYQVPLQVSEVVKSLTLAIAIQKLYARRGIAVPETVRQGYEDAMKMLSDISSGKASLDQPVGAAPQAAGGEVRATEISEKFSDSNISGFV